MQTRSGVAGDVERAREVSRLLGLPFHPVRFDGHDLLARTRFSPATFGYFVRMMAAPRLQLEWVGKHEPRRRLR